MVYDDSYARFAGKRHPQILGLKVLDAWPEAADWNHNVMEKVYRCGEVLSYEDQVLALDRHGSPEPAWMNLDYSRIVDDDGVPVGVIAVVVETTAKVRAEHHSNGERERLHQMFDMAPGFTALIEGPELRFEMANQAYLDLVGRDVIGKTVVEALPEVANQGFVDLLEKVRDSREILCRPSGPGTADQKWPNGRGEVRRFRLPADDGRRRRGLGDLRAGL